MKYIPYKPTLYSLYKYVNEFSSNPYNNLAR